MKYILAFTLLALSACAHNSPTSGRNPSSMYENAFYNLTEEDFGGMDAAIDALRLRKEIDRIEKAYQSKVSVQIRAYLTDARYCKYEFWANVVGEPKDKFANRTKGFGGEAYGQNMDGKCVNK